MQMQNEHNSQTTKDFNTERLSLIEHNGWIDLVEELKNLETLYSNLDSLESDRDLWFAKGQLTILRQIIGLEESTKVAVEQLDL
jgi:hypothetical protein